MADPESDRGAHAAAGAERGVVPGLGFGSGRREEITKMLSSIPMEQPGIWLPQLVKTTDFLHTQPNKDESRQNSSNASLIDLPRKKDELLETIDWNAYRFIEPSEISGVAKAISESYVYAGRVQGYYLYRPASPSP